MSVAQTTEYLWFLDTLVRIRVPYSQSSDGLSALEHRARHGHSPPVHVHRNEDKLFEILGGSFYFRIGDQERYYAPGEIVLARKGVPHMFRVDSASGGRWITVTSRGDFERFVRAVSRPAPHAVLPEPSSPVTSDVLLGLADIAREFGIELVGSTAL